MTTIDTAITTIKVPKYIRDYIKKSAEKHDNTIAEYLEIVLKKDERDKRIARLRREMCKNPPDATYFAEVDRWDELAGEGLDEY
jgi:hypothetical protein